MDLISKNIVAIIVTLSVLLLGCDKENENTCPPANIESGVLVLNEGLFQQNNSTLSFYSETDNSITQSFYQAINGMALGDTGNDMIRYGAKIYVCVNVSGIIEVLNSSTFESIGKIQMKENGNSTQPRNLVAQNGFIYASNFNGEVWQIDTTDFAIANKIQVGRNPEGLDVKENKLYVANSGGLDAPNYDSTVSVIDLNSNLVTETINIGINPSQVCAVGDFIYVISRGNYSNINPALYKINGATNQVVSVQYINPISIATFQNYLYIAYRETANGTTKIGVINPHDNQYISPDLISNLGVTTFYGFDIDMSGNLYIQDANSYVNTGKIRVFGNDGTFLKEFATGLNPTKSLKIN